jgi:hypothetical protein
MASDDRTSRRDWTLSVVRTAVSMGLLGRDALGNGIEELPPGLYAPSTDHLGHALMEDGPFHIIPAGCPTDYVRPSAGPFEPRFFAPHDFSVIRRIVELLLVDEAAAEEVAEWIDLRVSAAAAIRESALHLDPLHRAVAVAYFGAAHVIKTETFQPEVICREGLQWIDAPRKNEDGRGFLSLDESAQLSLLKAISDEQNEDMGANAGTRLFAYVKAEAIRGFYSSRTGLKELDFKGNAFYARSPGCSGR